MAQNLQLAVLFCCGYLVSRLLVKAGAPERLVAGLFARRPTHARLILYLVAGTASLSVFIPNAVTVITVLPVIALVRDRLVAAHPELAARLTTVLALAVIYGANIGGMGSITGTPANGILVLYALLDGVPDHGLLRFDRWLLWGLPLVALMVAASAAVICASAGPTLARERLPALIDASPRQPLEPFAWRAAGAFLGASFALSAAMSHLEQTLVLAVTVLLGAGLALALFCGRACGERILTVRDCWRGLPLRGLAFVAAVVAVAAALAAFGLVDAAAAHLAGVLPARLDSPGGFAAVALVTSFATEVFSNTVIQLAMFEAVSASPASAPVLIELLLVVTLSCTCAFMSPLATGVNGLVFGELRGASLARMLCIGAVMNCLGAVLVGVWIFALVR